MVNGAPSGLQLRAAAELAEKVAALALPAMYPDAPAAVECIETHMSWVFLTAHHAYKLKKPVISDALDFSTLAKRQWFCMQELLLNRRLSPRVYQDVVALTRDALGGLHLNGGGDTVDYLVRMERLPAAQALDRRIAQRSLTRADLHAVVARLAEFYRHAQRVEFTAAAYRARFVAAIEANRSALRCAHYELPVEQIDAIAQAQLGYVNSPGCGLPARAEKNHIVDAHGDLRPEHIYLTRPVQIVDCLEFERDLRLLDPLHELAFLAMECARLGAPQCGKKMLRLYQVASSDSADRDLLAFYQAHSACSRAKVAIWHLDDPDVRDHAHWRVRARTYLDIAEQLLA